MRPLFPVLFLAALGCTSDPADPPRSPPAVKPVASVKAARLFLEYADNAIEADKKYKGRVVEVFGSVAGVRRDADGYRLDFITVEGEWPSNLVCAIPKSEEASFAPLKRFQKIKATVRVKESRRDPSAWKEVVVVCDGARLVEVVKD